MWSKSSFARIVNLAEKIFYTYRGFTVISQMVTFPDGFFPGKTFPGKSFPGWSFSRIGRFPERRFPRLLQKLRAHGIVAVVGEWILNA